MIAQPMRSSDRLVLGLGMVALLCGCLSQGVPPGAASPAPDSPNAAASTSPVVYEAELTGCDHADLYIPVPASQLAGVTPPEFEIATAGVGPGGGPMGMVFVGALLCDHFAAVNVTGRGDFAWTDIGVVPRDASMAGSSGTIHLLRLEHYALPGAMEEVQTLLGDHHEIAEIIQIDIATLAPSLSIVSQNVTHSTAPALAGLAPSSAFSGTHLREFGFAEGGYTYVDLTVAPGAQTTGAVPARLSAQGGIAPSIVGPTASGTLITARFDFADVSMGFLPVSG